MNGSEFLVCKKSLYVDDYGKTICFQPGDTYKISYSVHVDWTYDPGKHKKHMNISFEEIHFIDISFRGCFINRKFGDDIREQNKLRSHLPHSYIWFYIWDYFYTKQEWRKIKLKRLQKHEL